MRLADALRTALVTDEPDAFAREDEGPGLTLGEHGWLYSTEGPVFWCKCGSPMSMKLVCDAAGN